MNKTIAISWFVSVVLRVDKLPLFRVHFGIYCFYFFSKFENTFRWMHTPISHMAERQPIDAPTTKIAAPTKREKENQERLLIACDLCVCHEKYPSTDPSKCVSNFFDQLFCDQTHAQKAEQNIEDSNENTYGGAHAPFVLPVSAITYSRHSSSAFVSRRNSSLMFATVRRCDYDARTHDARRPFADWTRCADSGRFNRPLKLN